MQAAFRSAALSRPVTAARKPSFELSRGAGVATGRRPRPGKSRRSRRYRRAGGEWLTRDGGGGDRKSLTVRDFAHRYVREALADPTPQGSQETARIMTDVPVPPITAMRGVCKAMASPAQDFPQHRARPSIRQKRPIRRPPSSR